MRGEVLSQGHVGRRGFLGEMLAVLKA